MPADTHALTEEHAMVLSSDSTTKETVGSSTARRRRSSARRRCPTRSTCGRDTRSRPSRRCPSARFRAGYIGLYTVQVVVSDERADATVTQSLQFAVDRE